MIAIKPFSLSILLITSPFFYAYAADDSDSSSTAISPSGVIASGAALAELKKLNDATIPAVPMANAESLNNLFATPDALFPTVNATSSDQLDTLDSVNSNSNQQTQNYLQDQLETLSNKIGHAYNKLSINNSEELPDPLKDAVKKLTYDTPSYDTFYLPDGSCTPNGSTIICAEKPSDETAQKNANSLNFDAFFGNNNYSDDNQQQAESYIEYVLETYQPTFESASSDSNAAAGDNKGFFDLLDEKLTKLGGSNDSSDESANQFLVTHVLENSKFQKFWVALRSYQAKRSMIMSNFNYLKAERTPQPGLGTAYGLTDTPDASALEVENGLLDKTINNPEWYQQMKTASPVTLQREQLLLTSLLLRVEARNKSINERNLATLSILTDSLLKQGKQALIQQENDLKNAVFPSDSSSQ